MQCTSAGSCGRLTRSVDCLQAGPGLTTRKGRRQTAPCTSWLAPILPPACQPACCKHSGWGALQPQRSIAGRPQCCQTPSLQHAATGLQHAATSLQHAATGLQHAATGFTESLLRCRSVLTHSVSSRGHGMVGGSVPVTAVPARSSSTRRGSAPASSQAGGKAGPLMLGLCAN